MQRLLLAPLLLIAAMSFVACGSDDNDSGGGGGGNDSAAQTETQPAQQPANGCKQVSAPKPRSDGGEKKPVGTLDAGTTYDVTMKTNCGSFTIRLDQKASPNAAASFVSLTKKGFFDNTVFHRIVPGFVIQGGDPTASGTGSPGYSTRDTPAQDTAYTRGVVAMAKNATTPAGTAESQFYVVTGADAGLPPEYAVLGKVVKGLAVTERIGELGDPASGEQGTPTQAVVISEASVSER